MSSRSKFSKTDRKWMQLALEIAERGAGYVSPNPMVGCVIVSNDGKKIGQGYHERYGQAHAEVNALQQVKNEANLEGATIYVTLEPCAHHGQTPPCCEMLGELPIKRVVVAMEDPTKKVGGKGIKYLRQKGITVEVGLMENEARDLNEFFLHFHQFERPFVTLKIAQTADGYIAAPDGDSQWISGQTAREQVHRWRSRYDAVMVGRNTARLDNPRLTVRHVEGRQPRRIVIDGPMDLPDDLNLFTDQYEEKTIIVTHNREKYQNEADPMLNMLQSNYFRGKTLLVPEVDGHSDLESAMKELAELEVTSILVEAGQSLATALIKQRLVDKLELFISPKLLGGGTRSLLGLGINHMKEIIELRDETWRQVGDDLLLTGYL
ncbi:bifunctional diaminohydroxyphosphoribosylaminopyrimidine deaminase/5-amino-6-(5-phosphoribosylamino)uracil reductase RibD [Aliifodinibius sp. S!AR15-10]|uniref:bifunctional diaminohydroxyphosphoribosylaminopyrimidine deaminase/5-amino-6-(5-phosphoribosylamino)uracil reductase RibD n=1 Tax=Aliifodinibius sp. S!AR15-10 TaxID=2950437 RepID=UPI0028599278|nr:bifunctional diaminohydroxyphosphoribosylaminopyrimidine deaminase/5-amino-6-(5-phosphoribosylamino)uracil reductase RibD [Aliifodinibius sp. S!AR15-10]MDR8392690.1 bifunctional diaminohydroxyphosphoribosylaminopyrimidine deaminase/5-amino-6-(5-phosphoribosylamino)uracil reductase RibD [Aliifodinibius sp. S!AR15-10]